MTETEARRRVAEARVARLATLAPGGRLHLVPICFAVRGATLYTAVDAKPKRSRALQRLANVRAHPDVCVLVDRYDEDWSRLYWVRVRGRARVLERGPEHEVALLLLREKYAQYAADPLGPVIAVDADEWRWWAASNAA
jgi:PPOX class probable F420-dependent enzyme